MGVGWAGDLVASSMVFSSSSSVSDGGEDGTCSCSCCRC